jgi:hypothetical protein
MPKVIQIIMLPLLLTAILGLFSFYGCSSTSTKPNTTATSSLAGIPAENLNQQQLQQMLSDSVTNYKNLNTYKFDVATDITTKVTGGSNPWGMTLNTKMGGGTNIASEQTQMKLDMSMAMVGLGQNGENQSLTYDMYAMPDWLYLNMFMPGMSAQWMKVRMSSTLKDKLNLNTVDQQMESLNLPTKIEYLRTEKVDGIDCYVLSISPSEDELVRLLGKQAASSEKVDWQKIINDSGAFKNFSFLCYVAKDTSLIMRMVMNMTIELSAAEAGAETSDFDKMQMNLVMDMKLYDHNKPYSITLPDEAASAQEVSEDIFSQ